LPVLRQLLNEATPGPWIADSHEIYRAWAGIPELNGDWIGETCRIEGDPLHSTSDADAALIVALRNAAPALLDRLERQAAAIEAVQVLADEAQGRQDRSLSVMFDGSKFPVSVPLNDLRTALSTSGITPTTEETNTDER
jgi:hypothetical protein